MADLLPPLKPIAIKERLSILFIEKDHLDVSDGAFVVVDKSGVRTHLPAGGVACLMLDVNAVEKLCVPRTCGDEPHCH